MESFIILISILLIYIFSIFIAKKISHFGRKFSNSIEEMDKEKYLKQKVKEKKQFEDAMNKIYEEELVKDVNFNIKIDKIKNLIIKEKIRDLKVIAEETNSTLEECVLKIKFLESKNQIPNIHLNTRAYTLIECSLEDEELLNKYASYLNRNKYNDHIDFKYKEILYLYKKGLIPEIEINEKTKRITFLELNKKKDRDLITIICSNCGALNDVNRGCKTKCQYCNADIDDSK